MTASRKLLPRVYIAGPFTTGDPIVNMRRALDAADVLLRRGYAPYVPHLTGFWQFAYAHDYETWLSLDMAFLVVCNAVLRLPGISPGADREVVLAKSKGIKVEFGLDKFPPL